MERNLTIKHAWLFNFIFSETSPKRWNRHIAFWTLRLLFFLFVMWFNQYFKLMPFKARITHIAILNIIHIGLEIFFVYTIMYFLIPRYFYARKYFLLSFFILLLCIFDLGISFYVIYHFFDFQIFSCKKLFNILWGDVLNFLTMGPPVVCIFFLIVKMLKAHFLENEKRKIILRENVNAELQLLKAQIHPHFLFNTLNNIYFFIFSNPEKAKGLINKLEQLLYYIIHECNQPCVPLSAEVNMIKDYLALEKVRYGPRLDMHIEISGDFHDKIIAPLLLIPFVENSFKHGTSQVLRNPWIRFIIQADSDILHFTIANSKPADEIEKGHGGIGLNNVQKRLELLYPSNHFLLIEATENTFTVNMQIPLKLRNKISEREHAAFQNS
jgi:sensor histidine kinase YesM